HRVKCLALHRRGPSSVQIPSVTALPTPSADAGGPRFEALDLPDAEIVFYPAFFSAAEADRLLRELRDTTAWRRDTITFFGRIVDVPRLTAWSGDQGTRDLHP